MIKIVHRVGQLANSIWAVSYSVVDAVKTGDDLYIFFFDEYLDCFDNIREKYRNIHFIAPFSHKHNKRLFFWYNRLMNILIKLLSFFRIYDKKMGPFCVVDGWGKRNLISPSDILILKEFFVIKKNVLEDVDTFYFNIKKEYDLIVGVHIRKGDYRTYKAGMLYHTDDEYAQKIIEINTLFPIEKVFYIICSNEDVDLSTLSACNISFSRLPFSDKMHDLYALIKSDYIFAAPSTFSRYASFMGKVPLALFEAKDKKITLNDFKLTKALNAFID